MTTLIYFFLMALTLFIVPQLVTQYINGRPVWDKNIRYLFYAAIISFSWYFLPRGVEDMREINFLQHAIGGGVSVAFVAIYLLKSLREKLEPLRGNNFFVELILVYMLVSASGAANELLEFALDAYGIGMFSADRYDTWFDILANTSGTLFVFLVYKIITFRNLF